MTVFQIKLIAISSMVIDHLGYYFFPNIIFFRIIGRLAFPLFAWLIANGAYHTKSKLKYFFRLILLALISQAPYIFLERMVDVNFWQLNIFFTLAGGLLAIMILRKKANYYLKILLILLILLISQFFYLEYQAFGILTIIGFYIFFNQKKTMVRLYFLLLIIDYIIETNLNFFTIQPQEKLTIHFPVNMFSLAAFYFIARYNNKQGPKAKLLFYSFYPVHLYILLYIKLILLK